MLADRQLGTRRGAGRPDAADEMNGTIGAFVVIDELPALAAALRLDRQVAALSRWFLGRRTA